MSTHILLEGTLTIMTLTTLNNFLDPHVLISCLEEVDHLKLDRYNNPFEQKWFLADKAELIKDGSYLRTAFVDLFSMDACKWVSRILNLPIYQADFMHYGGVFVYEQGDYLSPHVDAGLHPHTPHLRKVATALLYLTPATLQTWRGDLCTQTDPTIWLPTDHQIKANTAIVFANTDDAWHGVPTVVHLGEKRIVLTVSYMALPEFQSMRFRNTRNYAYFAKRVGEGNELDELRKLRSTDPSTVYNMEKSS